MFGFSRNNMEQSPFNKAIEKKKDEEKVEVFKKMGEISYQNILLRSQEILSDEDNEKLDEIAGGESAEKEIFNFLQEKIPNFSEIIKEEVEKTQEIIENNMNKEENNNSELEPENIDVESLSKLGEVSIKKISREILETSEGEEKERFEKVLDSEDEQKIVSYIELNYPELLKEKNQETKEDFEFIRNEIKRKLEERKAKKENE